MGFFLVWAVYLGPKMSLSKPMFASVPPEARFACTGLVLMGKIALLLVGLGALFVVADYPPRNPAGALLVCCLLAHFFLLGAAALSAALLLSAGKPLGRALAWCVVPFCLVNNPIFLVLSILVVQALVSRDMRLHLGLGAAEEELRGLEAPRGEFDRERWRVDRREGERDQDEGPAERPSRRSEGEAVGPEAVVPAPASSPRAGRAPARRPRREEEVYYEDSHVLVTGDGLQLGARRYPLRHVTEVEKYAEMHTVRRKTRALTLGTAGSFLGAFLFLTSSLKLLEVENLPGSEVLAGCSGALAVLCVCAGAVCVWASSRKVEEYALVLIDRAQAEEELWFRSKGRRDAVLAAVRGAIGGRG